MPAAARQRSRALMSTRVDAKAVAGQRLRRASAIAIE